MEEAGLSYSLGATVGPGGTNFSVYSRGLSSIDILLFDREHDSRPEQVISLDPVVNRTYHYWHVFEPGIRPG
jgi:glycogen operon protein